MKNKIKKLFKKSLENAIALGVGIAIFGGTITVLAAAVNGWSETGLNNDTALQRSEWAIVLEQIQENINEIKKLETQISNISTEGELTKIGITDPKPPTFADVIIIRNAAWSIYIGDYYLYYAYKDNNNVHYYISHDLSTTTTSATSSYCKYNNSGALIDGQIGFSKFSDFCPATCRR